MRRTLFLLLIVAATTASLLAQTPVILHTFTGPDGAQPVGTFVQNYEGDLIGTTYAGGANGDGAVYSITPTGTFTLLYSFTGGNDGSNPGAGVTLAPDGSMYGTTQAGGANGVGTMWQLTSSGTLNVVHAFGGTASSLKGARDSAVDGATPTDQPIWGPEDMLWGTTTGGGANSLGTVFYVTPDFQVVIVHDFGGDDGEEPTGGLLWASDGNFYGTAQYGGTYGYGTLFRITPDGVFTVLHDFTGGEEDGGYPCAGLEEDPEGYLQGSTMVGGFYGDGTDFEWSIADDDGETTFDYDGTDGDSPDYSLFLSGIGYLISTTGSGGASGLGNIVGFDPASPADQISYPFNGANGAYPEGGVFQAIDGDLYTTTQYGGSETNQGFILKFPMMPAFPPITTMSVSNSAIGLGESFTLSWKLNVGYSMTRQDCFAMGTDTSEWNGWQPATGSKVMTPTTDGSYDYGLICGGGIVSWGTVTVSGTMKYPTTTVLTAPASVVAGASGTLTATVTGGPTPTGDVNFQYNGTTFATGTLNGSGVATVNLPTSGLPLGSYSITANYPGDSTHYGSYSLASTVALVKQPSSTTLVSSAGGTVTQGGALTLTSTVTGGSGTQRPTGSVTFTTTFNGGTVDLATIELNNSQQAIYSVDTSIIPAGSYPVTANYSGDATFAGSSSAPVTITIKSALAATTTTVTVSPNPPNTGQPATVTAVVTGDNPTGTVSLQIGAFNVPGLPLSGGTASYHAYIPTTECGSTTVTGTYSGDSMNAGSSGSTTVNVLGGTQTTVTANPSTVKQGGTIALTATVSSSCTPTPSGSVTFSANGINLGSATLNGGTATYSATLSPYIATGNYSILASYPGDASHAGSTGTTIVTVTQ